MQGVYSFYLVFAEVPDPVIYLKNAIEQEKLSEEHQIVENENKKLKLELEASKTTISEGKAELELVKELQNQISAFENTVKFYLV